MHSLDADGLQIPNYLSHRVFARSDNVNLRLTIQQVHPAPFAMSVI
jgi:hypothetical protein